MSDYLWDKSGETDEEVEEFEEILGELRFKPEASAPPAALLSQVRPRRTAHWSRLVAAAALILMGLAGLWLSLAHFKAQADVPAIAREDISAPPVRPEEPPSATESSTQRNKGATKQFNQVASGRSARHRPPFTAMSARKLPETPAANEPKLNQDATVARAEAAMSAEELAEARRARAELMLALQVASVKLNHAQRRVQNPGNNNPGIHP